MPFTKSGEANNIWYQAKANKSIHWIRLQTQLDDKGHQSQPQKGYREKEYLLLIPMLRWPEKPLQLMEHVQNSAHGFFWVKAHPSHFLPGFLTLLAPSCTAGDLSYDFSELTNPWEEERSQISSSDDNDLII